jgi:hypothetical protein
MILITVIERSELEGIYCSRKCLLYAPRGIDLAIESGGKGGNLSRSFYDQQELKPANR